MAVAGSLTYETKIDKNGFEKGLNNLKTAGKTSLGTIENATKNLNNELGKTQIEEEKVGQSTLKLGDIIKANLISDAIKSGLSAVASGISKIGSSLVSVGKSAIESYANYEQLIGGVETLFKDSAGIVENYANNAYKTAGLSANEYMETVTSFSASLLQSLNGDTAKSAKVADMAISDMSDNANKMGTDMSMIQNAYQGFAKQNYTMLDNLKLGYGGTKTEMERLLADAEKLSGQKYDISNLNDVYEAIHVVQQEMGITGTTAKEASQTISGSTSAMKSAWQNLLTGIADDNANWHNLINNFTDSLITMLNNLLPRIQETLYGIIGLIVQVVYTILPQLAPIITETITSLIQILVDNLPDLLETVTQLITTLVNGLSSALPQLIPVIMQIITTIVETLIQSLPQILQMGITILVSLIQGITQSLPTLIPIIVNAILLMVETLIGNMDMIIDAGIQLIIGLAEGLINAIPQLIEKIPVIIDKLISAITNNLPKIIQMGITLIIKLAEGLIKAIPQLVSKIPQIVTSIINGFKNYFSNMWDVGKNLVSGIWERYKKRKKLAFK